MKKIILVALLMIAVGTVGCGAKTDKDVTIIGGRSADLRKLLRVNTK